MIKNPEYVLDVERVRRQINYGAALRQGLTGAGIGIGVLDSGVLVHKDLETQIRGFQDFVYGKRRPYDDSGHGTYVCGVIASDGSMSMGKYHGIAPDANLYVGKILDSGGDGEIEILVEGLRWLVENKAKFNLRIINISISTKADAEDEDFKRKRRLIEKAVDEVYEAGIILVAAAGNFGPQQGSVSVIGESRRVICVGCHDGGYRIKGKKMCEEYSGRGPSYYEIKKPDIVAPGTEITSCGLNGYVKKSGTSMATPIVTGALALLCEKYPDEKNWQIMRRLLYHAKDLGEPWSKQGWGMVDLGRI